MKATTDTRLYGADFLRASACLIVLFHHLAQRMGSVDFGAMEWFRVFQQIGPLGVAIFFVLSGFLLARPFWTALDASEPMPSIRTYALRRAARILPGFWLALTVTFILAFTVFGFALDGQLVLRYLAGFFLLADWHWVTFFPVEINGPLWSISFEVTSYVLLPFGLAALFLLRPATGRGIQSRVLWLGVIGIALGLHWLFVRYYPIDSFRRDWRYGLMGGAKFWMPRFNPFAFFAMFAVGSLAAGLQVMLARWQHWIFDLLSVAGLALIGWGLVVQAHARVIEGYALLGVPYAFPLFELAVAFTLAVTPSSVLTGRILDNPVTRYIAMISFGIYVWHNTVIDLVRVFWAPTYIPFDTTNVTQHLVVSLVIIGLSILVAHLSYRLLEKPVIDWARGRERRPLVSPTLSPAAG